MCTDVYYRGKEIITVAQLAEATGYAVRELPVHQGYEPLDADEDGHGCLCPVNVEQVAAELNLICKFDAITYKLFDRDGASAPAPNETEGEGRG